MKVIYVAGKYSDKSHSEIDDNIRIAEKAAVKLWAMGWAVICPHKNTAHFEIYEDLCPGLNYHTWIEGNLELLKRCDAIFMLTDWEKSAGAKLEESRAIANTLPIFYENDGYPDPEDLK